MSLWDEDCIKMGPGKPAVFGKAAIDKGKRAGYQKADVESQIINVEEVRVAGEWGFARGTFTATEKSKKDGAVAHADGKYLTIFKKQADGSWKIFRDCYNSN
jgi:ketosteroid isomerase-like protein